LCSHEKAGLGEDLEFGGPEAKLAVFDVVRGLGILNHPKELQTAGGRSDNIVMKT
jgi:hypothetical protein